MSTSGESGSKHLDIRKYPNRRYYDATHSRHLTIEEIRSLIRDGYDIKVTDSKSGADITAQVLTQIILELETPKLDQFPVALLLRLIRVNDQMVKDFIEKYFNQAFTAFVDYQKQIEERMRQMHGMTGLFPPFAAWTQAVTNPFAGTFGSTTGEKAGPPPQTAKPEGIDGNLREAMKDLQRQVEGLQQELKKAKGRRRKS